MIHKLSILILKRSIFFLIIQGNFFKNETIKNEIFFKNLHALR